MINVCLAGATGWAGSELARSIAKAADLTLVGAVSRTHAGRDLGEVLEEPFLTCPIYASAADALGQRCDVFVEYTKPEAAKRNILTALESGAAVVVGTSGLTEQDYEEIDTFARRQERGVLACGNFALTAVLMQKFAETAAKLIPQWEIFDYAHDDKVDAPSGTARELAHRLSKVRRPEPTIPLEQTVGLKEARGATVSASQVHSVRLPGYALSTEIVFGMPDQRLTIRCRKNGFARLYLAKALILVSLAAFWPLSGLIALTLAFNAATAILTSHGFPPMLAKSFTVVSSLADIAIGVAIAFRRTCRAGLLAGIAVSLFYVASRPCPQSL